MSRPNLMYDVRADVVSPYTSTGDPSSTTPSTPFLSSSTPNEKSRPTAHIRGRVKEILLAVGFISVPMVVLSAILLGLIYGYLVQPTSSPFNNLRPGPNFTESDSRVLFVDLSATTLVTIASWSSTVAPMVLSWAVVLISYPVAKDMIFESQASESRRLPTPYQFSLVCRTLYSSMGSALWAWGTYLFGWRGKREQQSKPLRVMATLVLLNVLLSALVFSTDTWLHIATHTVPLSLISSVNPSTLNVSFNLHPACYNISRAGQGGCTLSNAAAASYIISNNDTLKWYPLMTNTSMAGMVKPYIKTDSKNASRLIQYAYLGMPPLPSLDNMDYTATTWAVETKCRLSTQACFTSIYGAGARYDCPFAMEGNLVSPGPEGSLEHAWFTDSSGKENLTTVTMEGRVPSIQNPYYFGAVFHVGTRLPNPTNFYDPEVRTGGHGGQLAALFCEANVYDVEYSLVNGTITRFNQKKSNISVTNTMQATYAESRAGNAFMLQEATQAVYNLTSAQKLADQFSLAYSKAALALAASGMVPAYQVEAQRRRTILVARVPKLPLGFLIASNLLLVVLGIVLAVLASIALRSEGTGEVQARLGLPALIASRFEKEKGEGAVEKIEDLFEERKGVKGRKIVVTRSEVGGWKFVAKESGREDQG